MLLWEITLGNKIKRRTYSVFAAYLRTITGTDIGVICLSGLQCFYTEVPAGSERYVGGGCGEDLPII